MSTNRCTGSLCRFFFSACYLALIQGAYQNETAIVSNTVRCCDGKAVVRTHLVPTLATNCRKDIVILGVGTAMATNDYDRLSHALVRASTHDLLVIVLDPNPYDPLKLSQNAFAFAVNWLIGELERLINISPCDDVTLVLGGHSAGGATAINALTADKLTVPIAGYIGLDPFFVRKPGGNVERISVPSLLWGFATTSCLVDIDHAAKAAYLSANDGYRIFYQLSANFSHCCFTDSGCFSFCSCSRENQNLVHDIGVSVDQFIDALASKSPFRRSEFSTAEFQLDPSDITIVSDDETFRVVVETASTLS